MLKTTAIGLVITKILWVSWVLAVVFFGYDVKIHPFVVPINAA